MNKCWERRSVSFVVYGTPRPQGSMKSFVNPKTGKAVTTSQIAGLKPWRQEIACMAQALGFPMFGKDEPVEIICNFYFTRPKSVKRKAHTVAPDGDKLIRAVFDSLKGILVHDDAQFIEHHGRKHYGGPDRVEITVQEAIV